MSSPLRASLLGMNTELFLVTSSETSFVSGIIWIILKNNWSKEFEGSMPLIENLTLILITIESLCEIMQKLLSCC